METSSINKKFWNIKIQQCAWKRKSEVYIREYDVTNMSAWLTHPVLNPLFGNNSTCFIRAAEIGSYRDLSEIVYNMDKRHPYPCENASVCLFIAEQECILFLISPSYDMFAEYMPQVTVELVITIGKKPNPYFNRLAIKVYWTTCDIIYRIRARVYINSMTATRAVTSSRIFAGKLKHNWIFFLRDYTGCLKNFDKAEVWR